MKSNGGISCTDGVPPTSAGHTCTKVDAADARDNISGLLKAQPGEGGTWLMVDEDNNRTYKPGKLHDTGELGANDTLIVMDTKGNRYRWTMDAWMSWNDQRSDSMRRKAV